MGLNNISNISYKNCSFWSGVDGGDVGGSACLCFFTHSYPRRRMEMSCQPYVPAALPRGRNPATHWLWGWVGPIASRGDLEKESLPLPGFDLGSSSLFVITVGCCDLSIQCVYVHCMDMVLSCSCSYCSDTNLCTSAQEWA